MSTQKTIIEPSRETPVYKEADVLVVGGGPAGIMAALGAAESGLRVPDDVSLVCRESDPFLRFMNPVPCHYSFSMQRHVKSLFTLVRESLSPAGVAARSILITPHYERGGTLADLREAAEGKKLKN
jgi:DNA-binding LacI/PurR family transcriptional regulator